MAGSQAAPSFEGISAEARLVQLQDEIKSLKRDLDEALNFIAAQFGEDRQRISKLESIPRAAPATTKIHQRRLERVQAILISHNNQPMTFADMGKLLGYPSKTRKQNMTKLGNTFKQFPDSYEVKNAKIGGKLVRLNPTYLNHLLKVEG